MNIQKCCTTCKHYGPHEVLWHKCHLDDMHCGLHQWEPSYKAMADSLDYYERTLMDFIQPDEMRL